MPSKRTFHRYVVKVEILSKDPIPGDMPLSEMVNTEDYSVDWEIEHGYMTGPEMAKALIAQRSDPEIFGLTEDGEGDPDA